MEDTMILLSLSGEHPTLPFLEARHLFASADPMCKTSTATSRLLLIETGLRQEEAELLSSRLVLTKEALLVVQTSPDPFSLAPDPRLLSHLEGRTFAVRSRGFADEAMAVERRVGAMVLAAARQRGIRTSVRLDEPDVCLVVAKLDGKYVLGRLIPKPPRSVYQKRSMERPFKHPVGIDPAMARVMVNLAGLLPGGRLLDPFCGTGTILIEAGLVGGYALGIDSSRQMIRGCELNLQRYGIGGYSLLLADSLKMPLKARFDHLVTDPPYGRSSPSSVDVERIYESFPEVASQVIKPGGTLCMASPSTLEISERIEACGFKLEGFAYQRVHGSLGRHLYLARNC